MAALIEIEDLEVRTVAGQVLVSGVDLSLAAGEVLLLAGRSGAGKSLAVSALGDLLPDGLRSTWRKRRFESRDCTAPGAMRRDAGLRVGWVFQDPRASFHPTFSLGRQLDDAARIQGSRWPRARSERRSMIEDRLAQLGLAEAAALCAALPHEVSGGELQRVALAAALLHDPVLLVADEATSQLDAPHRLQLLDLLERERRDRGLALILVAHDLGLVLDRADRVVVFHEGRIVERIDDRSSALGKHEVSRALLDARLGLSLGRREELQ